MNLKLNPQLADSYKSFSQIARVLTENWVKENSYCPNCGADKINEYQNNNPFGDFYCVDCKEDFELKGKNGRHGKIISDGSLSIMLKKLSTKSNPNVFLLNYSKSNWSVNDFLIIPKHFFQSSMIEKRKPLKNRPTYIMCNINIGNVPELGKIHLIKNSIVTDRKSVLEIWNKTVFLREKSNDAKGWTLDVLSCLDKIKSADFSLDEVYKFENELKVKHPENNFVKDKIRQQLQVLRDKNIIEFVSKGKYRKL
jgi:type II restriction enzyme